jgi:disulfide oxidoreductase YuzD
MNSLKEFFDFTGHLNNNNKKNRISGQCKLCDKLYSDNAGSTGNFHKHLKRKHSTQYEKMKYLDCIASKNDDIDEQHSETILTNNINKINQATDNR